MMLICLFGLVVLVGFVDYDLLMVLFCLFE